MPPPGTPAGWLTDRTRPNDSLYFDGQAWVARRRWTPGGSIEVPLLELTASARQPGSKTPTPMRGLRVAVVVGLVAVLAVAGVVYAISRSSGAKKPAASTSGVNSSPAGHSGAWGSPRNVDSLAKKMISGQLEYVSCASATFCMVVGGDGQATASDGRTWSRPVDIDPYQNVYAVSCPSVGFCVAVGGGNDNGGFAVTYRNGTWGKSTTVESYGAIAVSCATPDFCLLLGDSREDPRRYNGTGWVALPAVPDQVALRTVSCPTSHFCMAIGDDEVVTYDGANWSQPKVVAVDHSGYRGADNAITSLSCPSPNFCMAVDSRGNAFEYLNGSWTHRQIDAQLATNSAQLGLVYAADVQPASVSCTGSSFCVVVDAVGNAMTFRAGRWGSPTFVDSAASLKKGPVLDSVSCALPTECFAVDSDANEVHST